MWRLSATRSMAGGSGTLTASTASAMGAAAAAASVASSVGPRAALHSLARCVVRCRPATAVVAAPSRCTISMATGSPAAALSLTAAAVPASAASSRIGRRVFSTQPTHADIIYTQKIPKKKSAFRDRVRIHVSGGRGGSGCSSYDTDPYGKGGPDGANGGRGGDVYLVSTEQLSSFNLESFHLRAHNGCSGGSQLSKGRNGYSLKVPIPAGTIVSEIIDTDPAAGEYTLRFLADMDRTGLEIKVASGGAGGFGNRAFKTKYRKQARFSTVGSYGTAKWLHLELKCIADVGLVGYPNAGKSSLLAAISNATPEIANYPFTTLAPQVGLVEEGGVLASTHSSRAADAGMSRAVPTARDPLGAPLSLGASSMRRMRVADLPGLIAGAATANRGLGHEFLKHIQRTRVLCYVLDVSGHDGRDPVGDFLSLQQELHAFDPALLHRPSLIVANKIDNVSSGIAGAVKSRAAIDAKMAELATVTPLPILPASCLRRTGLAPVVDHLFRLVEDSQLEEAEDTRQSVRDIAEKEKALQTQREIQKREDDFLMQQQEEQEEQRRPTAKTKQTVAVTSADGADAPSDASPGKARKGKRLTKKQLAAAAAASEAQQSE